MFESLSSSRNEAVSKQPSPRRPHELVWVRLRLGERAGEVWSHRLESQFSQRPLWDVHQVNWGIVDLITNNVKENTKVCAKLYLPLTACLRNVWIYLLANPWSLMKRRFFRNCKEIESVKAKLLKKTQRRLDVFVKVKVVDRCMYFKIKNLILYCCDHSAIYVLSITPSILSDSYQPAKVHHGSTEGFRHRAEEKLCPFQWRTHPCEYT